MSGYGDIYSGTALCTFHDVIFVSINYRLGPFGEYIMIRIMNLPTRVAYLANAPPETNE